MLEKIDNYEFELTCKFKTFLYCVCENLWKAVLSKRHASTNYLTRRIDTDMDWKNQWPLPSLAGVK
ncbi:MAG: hypothetical protein MUO72_12535 [Bacteroidales bacterium]|nr:hypothetical protein [Bacteroidales bacterium]